NTAFGRSHDFARISTHDDFKRLVPVSTAADYAATGTSEAGAGPATSPGPSPQPRASRFRVPFSRDVRATFNQAIATSIAHIMAARPRNRLLNGQTVILNDDDTEALRAAVNGWHPVCRPYVETVADHASELLGRHLTCLVGGPSSILQLLKEVRRLTGRE